MDLSDLTDLVISQSSICGSTIKVCLVKLIIILYKVLYFQIITEEEKEEGAEGKEEVEGGGDREAGQHSEEEEGSDVYGITTFVPLATKQAKPVSIMNAMLCNNIEVIPS